MIRISGRKTTKDWWQHRIEDLKGKTEEARRIFKKIAENPEEIEAHSSFGEWTFLKLVSLSYCLDIYTNIAKKYFSKIFYIDICAGGGFVKIKRVDEIIAGSALLGKIAPKENKKFNKLILVEIKRKKAQNLKEILPESEVIFDDANSKSVHERINKIIKKESDYHFFGFVDPSGFEIHWNTIKFLLEMKGDVIINYMDKSVGRLKGIYTSDVNTQIEREKAKERLENFYDENIDYIMKLSSTELFDLYVKKIERYRKVTIPIKIEGLRGGYHYYMIFATRKTRGKQGWLEPIRDLKEKVERADDNLTRKWFQIYKGDQSTLDTFMRKS